jgi:hypothetical protein
MARISPRVRLLRPEASRSRHRSEPACGVADDAGRIGLAVRPDHNIPLLGAVASVVLVGAQPIKARVPPTAQPLVGVVSADTGWNPR